MKSDIVISIDSKRYQLTIAILKELLILNKKPITLEYEGFGSIAMKGLKEEYIKELDKVL